MSGLWQRLGFSTNPYFTAPISVSPDGRNLFVGRGEEVRRLLNKWDEKDGSITVVGGNIGTGKTSFLNVCQYLCMATVRDFKMSFDPPKLVPCFTKVQVETGQSDVALLYRVVRSAIDALIRTCDLLSLPRPSEVYQVSEKLSIPVAEEQGRSGVRELDKPIEPASPTADMQVVASFDELSDCLRRLAGGARSLGFRGLIVALDNIEMIDSGQIIEQLNKYRDTLFSVTGIWWVLIGQRGLYDLIDAEAPRVSQRIKGMETTLHGLSWEDFSLAIGVRMDEFKTREDAVPPIGDELLRRLFEASSGEIRYVFKMADEVVTDALAQDPNLQDVPPETASKMLEASVRSQVARLMLTDRERRVLGLLCGKGSARPKDYKEFGFQNAPNFIQGVLQPLQEKGFVSKSTQGNAALYSPRPLTLLAASFGVIERATAKSTAAE